MPSENKQISDILDEIESLTLTANELRMNLLSRPKSALSDLPGSSGNHVDELRLPGVNPFPGKLDLPMDQPFKKPKPHENTKLTNVLNKVSSQRRELQDLVKGL